MREKSTLGAVVLLLAFSLSAQEKKSPSAGVNEKGKIFCEIKMSNGSILKGKVVVDKVKLKTEFGALEFAVTQLKTIRMGDGKKEKDTIITNEKKDERYNGLVEMGKPLELDTGYGVLKIPIAAVKELRVVAEKAASKALFGDDFSGAELDKERWDVENGEWKVSNGILEGTGVSPDSHDSLYFNAEPENSYNLEVDVRIPKGDVDYYAGIIWNSDKGENEYNLDVVPGGLEVWSGKFHSGSHQKVSAWQVEFSRDEFFKIRLEVGENATKVLVNDKEVGSVDVKFSKGKVGLMLHRQQTVQFRNFKITR